jgi:hypothetical protein
MVGCSLLLHLTFKAKVSDYFTNLFELKVLYDFFPKNHGNKKRENHCHTGTERDKLKHSCSGNVECSV